MRDFVTYFGVFAFCFTATALLIAAGSAISWRVSRRRAERRAEREASHANLLRLLDRLDQAHALICALERHLAVLNKLSAMLESQRRTLEELAPSEKEPSSG